MSLKKMALEIVLSLNSVGRCNVEHSLNQKAWITEVNREGFMENDGKERAYRMVIADNFHFMEEEDETLQLPKNEHYWTLEEAVKSCENFVDANLREAYTPGMSAKELYQIYVMFGEDPYVVGPHLSSAPFSGREYAQKRCCEICGEKFEGEL